MSLEYPLISDESITETIDDQIDRMFPVGSVQITTGIDPSSYLPGSWVSVGQGRTLFGYDPNDTDFNLSGKTGGEKSHTLTVDEIPTHSHGVSNHSHSVPPVSIPLGGSHNHSGNALASASNPAVSTTSSDGVHSHSGVAEDDTHEHDTEYGMYDVLYGSGTATTRLLDVDGGNWQSGAVGSYVHGHNLVIDDSSGHTHTVSIPAGDHTHGIDVSFEEHTHTVPAHNTDLTSSSGGDAGGGGAHNNIPPYLVVYFWKRVS